MSFIRELRRRNVFRVAAGYALVAWILIEAGSVLLPTFGVPEWFFKVYVIFVMAGWVMSMIIAWVFEVTPEGVKLESSIDREKLPPASQVRTTGNWVLISLLLVALSVSLFFNLGFYTGRSDKLERDLSSVAILPFENRSTAPENGYFADGLHDDLRDRLASIESLRVISNTSVRSYRDTTLSMPLIGRELGVAAIIEGSVQREGDQVLVTIRLFDAAKDEQIWGSRYNEDASTLNSVFALQEEISLQISTALRAALTESDQAEVAQVPTTNVEAHRLYVQGINNLHLRRFETLLAARGQFEEAIALDPKFAKAHAALAETVMVLLSNHRAVPQQEAYEVISGAIQEAISLESGLADAYAVRGLLRSHQWERNRTSDLNLDAEADFERAIELNANFPRSYVWFGSLREKENRIDEAVDLARKSVTADPLNRIPLVNLAGLHALQGDLERSHTLLLRAMEIFPDWPTPYQSMASSLEKEGRLDEAVAWTVRLRELSSDPMAGTNIFGALRLFGQQEIINEFLDGFPEDHPALPVGLGYLHFAEGDYAQAIAALEPYSSGAVGSQNIALPLMARSAVLLGDYPAARRYLLQQSPVLASDREKTVDRFNADSAVLLAFVEQKLGNVQVADRLLAEALALTRSMPRTGLWGHGVRDVKILALQGKSASALDALEEAIEAGIVTQISFDFWRISIDPTFDSLRGSTRYIELRQIMQQRVDDMRIRIEEARDNNAWQSLRERTRVSELTT